MANYTVQDQTTGKKITFEWNDPNPPMDKDMEEIFAQARGQTIQSPIIPSETPKIGEQRGYFETLASNILPSAYETSKSYITPIIHPIETGKGMYSLGKGIIGKTGLGSYPQEEQLAGQMYDMLVERYGGIENLKETFKTDPVGIFADIGSLFTGGGAVLKGMGLVSKVSPLVKAGKVVSQIGKITEPTWAAGKIAGAALYPVKQAAKHGLGITTGMGSKTLEYAMKGEPEFMRGLTGGSKVLEETLGEAKSALEALKETRRSDYLPRLNQISQMKQSLDISPIKRELQDQIQKMRIKFDQNGKIIRGTIDPRNRGDAEKIIELVENWGKIKEDRTPIGLDELKRTLDDFYSESKSTQSMVTALRNKTKSVLTQNVPEYSVMVKNYELSSNLINEVTKGLSLGSKSSSDAAIKRLISTINDNQDFRRNLIQHLEESGGAKLLDKLAGAKMEEWVPSGLIGRGAAATAAGTAIFGNNPKILIGLSMTSPKLMGGLMWSLSNAAKQYRKITPGAKLGAFQTGRAVEWQKE